MTQKTKTIIKETEEVSEPYNPAVIAYRLGQAEDAIKEFAVAQRESTESHKESNKELAGKMDTIVLNLATKADLEAAQRQGDKDHESMNKRIDELSERQEATEKTTDGLPLIKKIVYSFCGLVLSSVAVALVALVVTSKAGQ